jgi:hypothetical protein
MVYRFRAARENGYSLEIHIINSSDTYKNVYGLTFDIFKFSLNKLSGNAIVIKENEQLKVIALNSGEYIFVQHGDQIEKMFIGRLFIMLEIIKGKEF